MRALFLLGWIFLLAAFAAAAAETITYTLGGSSGIFLSADDLWRSIFPGAYVITAFRMAQVAPWLWDPVLQTLLFFPAWAIFGIPGVVLAWFCRPGRKMTESEEQDLKEHEASLFLYDELAHEARLWARAEGESNSTDDRLPNHDVIDLFERADNEDDDDDQPPIDPLPEFVKPRND